MWDILRWLNVLLAMFVVAAMVAGSMARWHVMPKRLKRIIPWVVMTYVVIAYGSGEAARQDTPPGVRIALMLCTLAGLLVALLWRIDDDTYEL